MLTGVTNVLRHSTLAGFADYAVLYSVRSWVLGWLGRVIFQVAFFTMIGRLLDSVHTMRFLLVGNAVMMAALESLFVINSTIWERRTGTLPLLVCAPTSALTVFVGRSVVWMASGTVTSLISLFGLGALFGVPMDFPGALAAVPLVFLVSMSTYCFGLVLGGLVLTAMELRNVVGNVTHLVMMAVCGVQVPTSYWPAGVEHVASVLPLTHGLSAVRAVLSGAPTSDVLRSAGLELAVGLGWLTVAALLFDQLAERGRRDGSIEFGD